MKVVALQTWANGSLTMEEKQVADIPDDLAAYLIERGIVAESPEYYGGGSGGSPLVVHATPSEDAITLDKTWQQIHDADAVSIVFDNQMENKREFLFCSGAFERVPLGGVDTEYVVKVNNLGNSEIINFVASSASGYPSYTMK